MLRSFRPSALLAFLLLCTLPALHAQISPFAFSNGWNLLSCSSYDSFYPGSYPGSMFNSECAVFFATQPLRSYYQQSYYARHHGVHGYSSIQQAQLAYGREGLRALDGMKLGNGMKVGHGGQINVPGAGFVRPTMNRSTGRVSLPTSALQRNAGMAVAGNSGRAMAGGGASRNSGMHGGSVGTMSMAASGGSHSSMSGASHK